MQGGAVRLNSRGTEGMRRRAPNCLRFRRTLLLLAGQALSCSATLPPATHMGGTHPSSCAVEERSILKLELEPDGCETAPGAFIEVRGLSRAPYFTGTKQSNGRPIQIVTPRSTLILPLSSVVSPGESLHIFIKGTCSAPKGESVTSAFYCKVPE